MKFLLHINMSPKQKQGQHRTKESELHNFFCQVYGTATALALIATASFFVAAGTAQRRQKRYSGKQEIAPGNLRTGDERMK